MTIYKQINHEDQLKIKKKQSKVIDTNIWMMEIQNIEN